MKIILLLVTSLDGITHQEKTSLESHHDWTSQEDKDFFNSRRDKATLIFMGSKTYEGAKDHMKHIEGRLRIVFTKNPEKYETETIPNMLEFTNKSPKEIIYDLEIEGYKEALLVGGATINSAFFRENLVTELWQTVEPVVVGKGIGIVSDEKVNYSLSLISSEKLNDNGTLLLKYAVK